MKPIRVFYSELTGRFYASQHYKVDDRGFVVITGRKYDVTNDIAAMVLEHDIEFTVATKQTDEGATREVET